MAGALAGSAPASEEDMLAGTDPASAPDTRRLSESETRHSPFPRPEKENVAFLFRTAHEAPTGFRRFNRGRFRAVLMHRDAAIRAIGSSVADLIREVSADPRGIRRRARVPSM